jgi:hypothetical protein
MSAAVARGLTSMLDVVVKSFFQYAFFERTGLSVCSRQRPISPFTLSIVSFEKRGSCGPSSCFGGC